MADGDAPGPRLVPIPHPGVAETAGLWSGRNGGTGVSRDPSGKTPSTKTGRPWVKRTLPGKSLPDDPRLYGEGTLMGLRGTSAEVSSGGAGTGARDVPPPSSPGLGLGAPRFPNFVCHPRDLGLDVETP